MSLQCWFMLPIAAKLLTRPDLPFIIKLEWKSKNSV
jgi:hypothetical protein